jgi:porphyrinogen peroxidase
MNAPQSGIFALGNPSHAYLEFNLQPGGDSRALVTAMADLREPRTTIGGVNLVSGFRPELWRELVPDGLPDDLVGFNEDLIGGAQG